MRRYHHYGIDRLTLEIASLFRTKLRDERPRGERVYCTRHVMGIVLSRASAGVQVRPDRNLQLSRAQPYGCCSFIKSACSCVGVYQTVLYAVLIRYCSRVEHTKIYTALPEHERNVMILNNKMKSRRSVSNVSTINTSKNISHHQFPISFYGSH